MATANTLVSLPGYRSLIALDVGLHLTLWGNLPEFSPSPPVLESVVMLHDASPGIDVELTLDRGRVMLGDRKAAGTVRVRVRFLSEVWDVELPEGPARRPWSYGLFPTLESGSLQRPGRRAPIGKAKLATHSFAEDTKKRNAGAKSHRVPGCWPNCGQASLVEVDGHGVQIVKRVDEDG